MWDLKPILLDLCSDDCSTELASVTQEVTSKNTKLCLDVGNSTGLSPNSNLAQRNLNFSLLPSSVALLTFSLRLIMWKSKHTLCICWVTLYNYIYIYNSEIQLFLTKCPSSFILVLFFVSAHSMYNHEDSVPSCLLPKRL